MRDLPERGAATNAVASVAARTGDKMMTLLKCIFARRGFKNLGVEIGD